jgi:short-subunit dehydrogenase
MRAVITGATSGIGAELARQLAAPGVTLGLVGRRADRLEEVAAACRAAGAVVHGFAGCVTDTDAMANMAREFIEKAGGVDLVVANAGVGNPDRLKDGDAAPTAKLFAINVTGVTNTLLPFIPTMLAQRSGHLVAVASIAGFRALPGSVAYSASKAAVQTLMEGYDMHLRPQGIACTVINPGFVESELTAKNKFKMPFLLDTPTAVRGMLRAIRRRPRSYTFPWPMALLGKYVLPLAPTWLLRGLRKD